MSEACQLSLKFPRLNRMTHPKPLNPSPARTAPIIVIEGIDGTGKSTQAKMLAEFFQRHEIPACLTSQPTRKGAGQQLREAAENGIRFDPEEELRLVLLDKQEHAEEIIEPALARGEVVILDRYYFSTMAYQSYGGHYSPELLRQMSEQTCRKPAISFILDLPVELTRARIKERGSKPSLYEESDRLEHCREVFLKQAGQNDVHVLSATADATALHGRIVNAVRAAGLVPGSRGNFGMAVRGADSGKRIARCSWEKGTWVFRQVPSEIEIAVVPKMTSLPEPVRQEFLRRGLPLSYRNQLALVDSANRIQGWTPTAADLLAQDWKVLD